MGCFYCDEHHEGPGRPLCSRLGEMKAGVLYLFKDQAHRAAARWL